MPTQGLNDWEASEKSSESPIRVRLVRIFVFFATALLTAYATWNMYEVVGQTTATVVQIILVVLFALTFTWIALSAFTALIGFFALFFARGKHSHTLKATSARTVVLLPIYDEDTVAVFASLDSMIAEVIASLKSASLDFFVLSDSTRESVAAAELHAVSELRDKFGSSVQLYYRRRTDNEGKKSGNVAEFVRRWGGAYDFMIVLDADSYMTAEALTALVRAMEEDPDAGLIQTVPRLRHGATSFAQLQEFASKVYGPVLAAGLSLWHGREGNYWGHNAIIRVDAFARSCGLPRLRGRKPFGGHILSHDFVEAALLRRAGFAVYMRPDIEGSYEGIPPTFAEFAIRDRRWAQGNLQHSLIVPAAGLHWVSRLHLLNGIMSYLASPLWLLFLLTGIALSWQATTFPPDYFPSGVSLFPTWPQFDAAMALALLKLSLVVLLLPKVLALVVTLFNKRARLSLGGATVLMLTFFGELIVSALLAPVMMLVQSKFVAEILFGGDAGWAPQQRDGGDASVCAIARAHLGHTLIGIALCMATFMISYDVWLWLSPIWIGLCLSIPVVIVTSRPFGVPVVGPARCS